MGLRFLSLGFCGFRVWGFVGLGFLGFLLVFDFGASKIGIGYF